MDAKLHGLLLTVILGVLASLMVGEWVEGPGWYVLAVSLSLVALLLAGVGMWREW